MIKKTVLIVLFILIFSSVLSLAQETTEKKVSEEVLKVKTWRIPDNLADTLRKMVEDFNKRFQETVEIYKAGLKVKNPEFADMPEDAILDLQNGVFVDPESYMKLQKQNEVKKNEKDN